MRPNVLTLSRRMKIAGLVFLLVLAALVPLLAFVAQRSHKQEHTPIPPVITLATSTPGSAISFNLAPKPAAPQPPRKPAPVPTVSSIASPPGSALPGDAACAASVHYSAWEPRADNYAANHRIPSAQQVAGLDPFYPTYTQNPRAAAYSRRVSGNFSGTTDEIIQWAACKWGVNPDLVRAQAVTESYWHQNAQGGKTSDSKVCAPGTWNGSYCYQYYGLLQITYQYYKHEWPMMRDDTAFNADLVYGVLRMCYEGLSTYLAQSTPSAGYPRYHAGDIWGCIGSWYSGQWYDSGAIQYIGTVKQHMMHKDWFGRWF